MINEIHLRLMAYLIIPQHVDVQTEKKSRRSGNLVDAAPACFA